MLGHNFTLVTDHRPLGSFFNSPSKPAPFRVERIRLKLQGFRFDVRYKPRKWNPSDYLSLHPIPIVNSSAAELQSSVSLECHVLNTVKYNTPSALTLEEIQQESKADPVLSKILQGLQSENLNKHLMKQDPDLKHYVKILDELSIGRDIVE